MRFAPFILALLAAGVAHAQPVKLTFQSNWRAQAEHGGYYQAVATGIYAKHGLDVTVRAGGPQINNPQLLAAGVIDFSMGSDSFNGLNFVKNNIPLVVVGSMFQKDPRVLLAHPGQGNDSLAALKGKPILIASASRNNYWQFLRAKYGYTDDQIRAYTFNLQPFFADPTVSQQAYLSSEPFQAQQQGVKAKFFLFADGGYPPYGSTIVTTEKMLAENPDVVARFVKASLEGWRDYLKNPEPANALIKVDNPKMTDAQIAYAIDKLKQTKALDGGDAATSGIGIMTAARWKQTYDFLVAANLLDPKTEWQKAFTDRFVKDLKIGF